MNSHESFTWKLYLIFAWIDRLFILILLGLWFAEVINWQPAIALILLTAISNVFIAAIYVDPKKKGAK